MDTVIDHNFLLQALYGFQFIISFINNNRDLVETDILNTLKENPSYKFKDSKALQLEIETETHKLLKKLQSFTKMEYLHYLCVIDFIRNG